MTGEFEFDYQTSGCMSSRTFQHNERQQTQESYSTFSQYPISQRHSFSMIDENSNTMPFSQRNTIKNTSKHSIKHTSNNSYGVLDPTHKLINRKPFEEMQSSASVYIRPKQREDKSKLPKYSNDLSPMELAQQQLSTQSSSPEYDLALFKNPSQKQTLTNENKVKHVEYVFQDESEDNHPAIIAPATQHPNKDFIQQIEYQEVEDFSLYIQNFQKNIPNNTQLVPSPAAQLHALSQDDMYQEQLFGNNPMYVPKYAFQIVQNLFKQQVTNLLSRLLSAISSV